MPRATKVKTSKHGQAVQLPSKRVFAVPDEQVQETIIPDRQAQSSAPKELGPSDVSFTKLKKGKLPASFPSSDLVVSHPYSRSHIRREKRKSKQNLAGGDLAHLSTALSEVIADEAPASPPPTAKRSRGDEKKTTDVRKKDPSEKGKIGQGRGRTMTENGRRKQIALEAKRIPAIMQHPAYKASPWSTIRLHASNSLATVPPVGKKKEARSNTNRMEVE